jgi:hypothetical protein
VAHVELSYKYINYSKASLYASVLGSAQCFKRIVVMGQSKKCSSKAQERGREGGRDDQMGKVE